MGVGTAKLRDGGVEGAGCPILVAFFATRVGFHCSLCAEEHSDEESDDRDFARCIGPSLRSG